MCSSPGAFHRPGWRCSGQGLTYCIQFCWAVLSSAWFPTNFCHRVILLLSWCYSDFPYRINPHHFPWNPARNHEPNTQARCRNHGVQDRMGFLLTTLHVLRPPSPERWIHGQNKGGPFKSESAMQTIANCIVPDDETWIYNQSLNMIGLCRSV